MKKYLKLSQLNKLFNVLGFDAKKLSITILTLIAICTTPSMLMAATTSKPHINVVSSIKPIQLITTAVIGNLGDSKILLPPSANPHSYQLRPSQRALLNDADLFVWVGPELELFLVKVLKTSNVKQLALTTTLNLHSKQSDELTTEHDANEGYEHSHDEHSHDIHSEGFDPHIWLNPALTEQIAKAIHFQLSTQYPNLKPQLNQNLSQFITRLHTTEVEIAKRFESKHQIAIYTFHEAFTHFADHYGLQIAGTITRTPEARPGAKHLSELADEIRQNKKICLIKEPNFKAPYIDNITRGTDVILATADPLATNISNTDTGYFQFIRSIADSFYQCIH